MRWHFGGNLQPVRMICEYDWKECPIAVVSYIWSEIVTDVVDGLTGEGQLWRLLAIMALCLMLLHTMYYKIRWVNQSEHDSTRDHFMKVGYKMHDLELKINILTYKMQYGIWPLPHEIPKPSLNQLQNVKLTLSNTSRQNMWSKHQLHGHMSKCMQNSEDDRFMNEQSFANEKMKLVHQNFWSQFEDRKSDLDTRNPCKLNPLHGEAGCENYQRLLRTADECRKYIDEINESNKSLGRFENSTDMSDHNYIETESEKNYHRYLVDPKKWHGIQKCRNGKLGKLNEGDSTTSDQTSSPSNLNHKCTIDNERYDKERSENKSRLLPPDLSITFLSDKYNTLPANERSMTIEDGEEIQSKDSTNETLNKVKEKLENLHDIRHNGKNLKCLYDADGNIENKAKSHNTNGKNEKVSTNLGKQSGTSSRGVENDLMPIKEQSFSATRNSNSLIEHTDTLKNTSKSSSNLGNNTITPNDKVSIANLWNKSISKEMNKHSVTFPNKIASSISSLKKTSWSSALGEGNLSLETNSDESVEQNSTCVQKNIMNSKEKSSLCKKQPFESNKNSSIHVVSDSKSLKNNINITSNISTDSIQRITTTYVMSPKQKAVDQIPMDTDEDQIVSSQTSSHTELSKDSDTDDKSTTTLLREALEYKKVLLMQIRKEGEIDNSMGLKNESSEYDSDVSSRSKTDNRFRSKLLDIISEEQSAGSSTEKTSGTYILARAMNRTNLHEKFDDTLNKETTVAALNCANMELNDECYGDVKSLVKAISSEYFSITNIGDSKQCNAQKLNKCIADENGREQQEEYANPRLKGKLKSAEIGDEEINIISKNINEQLRSRGAIEKSEDIRNAENPVVRMNRLQILQRTDDKGVDYSLALDRSQRQTEKTEDIDKVITRVREQQNDTLENIEAQVNSITGNMTANSGTNIQFFRKLSSVDSEKAISWNSISESSSNGSIAYSVNTPINIESKNIDTIPKQKLMMRNSTNYEGRNFATAGEELQYMFDFRNKQPQSFVSISGVSVSTKNKDDIVEEISKMITDPAIFEQQKLEAQVKISPLEFDQEKLQRKQDILSKLKTLDAFTKPLDISDCNAENNDNDEDSSPLTGRTVVYTTNDQPEKNVSPTEPRKQENILDAKHISGEVNRNPLELGPKTTSEIGNIIQRISNFTRKETISHLKMERLSKSSITNFSTETSESYFDVSNHDFAVSSIILTSKNSNLADKCNDKSVRSDMSSLYVDASDHSSKLGTNSIKDNGTTNLSPKQNCYSESQLIKSHASTSGEITVSSTKIPKKDVKIHDGCDSRDDSLIKTRRIPKSTSSLLMNDRKSKLHTEKVGILTRRSLSLEQGRLRTRAVTKDQLCGHSSCSLNEGVSECDSKVISALPKSRAISKSSIPILKSRKDVLGREKSMEPKAKSQNPLLKSNTAEVKHGKSTSQVEATNNNNVQNENDIEQSLHGSRKSLNRKQSYTVPSKDNNTNQEYSRARPEPAENTTCRTIKSISKELAITPEKCNLLSTSGHLTKECTVIYINIISNGDKNELQGASAEELIKYVNDKHLIPGDRKSSPLSLKYSTSNESDETQVIDPASPRLKTQVYKNSGDSSENKMDKTGTTSPAFFEIKEKIPKALDVMGSIESSAPSETTANKLLSTSTLQLSNLLKVEKREIEVSATPSVKNTSTSVSDFPDATQGEKHLTYNTKNEVFDVPKETVHKEQIVLTELLADDPDFFECRKTHRFYNKLGLSFQE